MKDFKIRSKVITSDEKEAWKCVTSGMMSKEETMEDRKISRRRPNWRSDKMNKWIDELDIRGTDLWKVPRKERVDGSVLQVQPPTGLQAWMVN